MATADIKDVSMTYSSALEIAKAIDDKRMDFDEMRSTLDDLVDSLSGQWESTAQREFVSAYNKLKPKLKQISETLERYSTIIRTTVSAEQEQDQNSSSRFSRIASWFMPSAIGKEHKPSKQEKDKNQFLDSSPKTNTEASGDTNKSENIRPYTNLVKQGTIRYVSQNSDLSNNGWGNYSGYAGGECGYASQSMALSYIGKDVSPSYLCENEYANGKWHTSYYERYNTSGVELSQGSGNYGYYGSEGSSSDAYVTLNKMLKAYNSDRTGTVSPVVIHYSNASSGKQHAVVIIGNNGDGTYKALCPSRGINPINLSITPEGTVNDNVWHGGQMYTCVIDGLQQFVNIDSP